MVEDGDLCSSLATSEYVGLGIFGWKFTPLNWEKTLDTVLVLESKECLPKVIIGAFFLIELNFI